MTDANDLTLRNDVTGALIAGGHWHGGGNYEICATIAALCKAANERDNLRNLLDIAMGQSSDFKEEAKYLRAQVAELVKALRQYADPMNWGYRDEGGCEKGHGRYEDACFVGREIAEAAIAAAERREGE